MSSARSSGACLATFGVLVATAQETPDAERGQAVFDYWCAPCHAPGPVHPGTQSLELKCGGSLPAVL